MRHCVMYNTLHVTESLPRGNCVLSWPSQLRHVRKRYLLASKSRPRLPVSYTRLTTLRYRYDTFSDGNTYARKHLRFRRRLCIRGICCDIRALRNPTSLSPDRKRIAAIVQLTEDYRKLSDLKQDWYFFNWDSIGFIFVIWNILNDKKMSAHFVETSLEDSCFVRLFKI